MDANTVPVPETRQYTVSIADMVLPKQPDKQIKLLQYRDSNGFPCLYSHRVQCEVVYQWEVSRIDATIFWDRIGNYLRYEWRPEQPLTKKDNLVFQPEDYVYLDEILKNRDSVLGSHLLAYMGNPGKADPRVDGMSAATPKTLQDAVVKDAAWTTWVMWQYANGELVEKLRQVTIQCATPEFLHHLLRSDDLYENEFALEVLLLDHTADPQYLESVLIALQRGDISNVNLALQYLDKSIADRSLLYDRLVDSIHKMEKGYIPMVVRFLAADADLSPQVFEGLTEKLDTLSYFQVNAILNLLEERAFFSSKAQANVSRLLQSESPGIVDRASVYLSRIKNSSLN